MENYDLNILLNKIDDLTRENERLKMRIKFYKKYIDKDRDLIGILEKWTKGRNARTKSNIKSTDNDTCYITDDEIDKLFKEETNKVGIKNEARFRR